MRLLFTIIFITLLSCGQASAQDSIAYRQAETASTVHSKDDSFRPWIAVKSNVLYDAAMTPNIEVERWFGRRHKWSVMAECNFPWWEWHNKERVYEVFEAGMELRHWLSNRRWLTGHFIGLYGAAGYYDLEWDYKGEQGHFYSGGITYGYGFKLSRHWNLELSLSGGYVYSPYTHYEAEHHDDDLFAKTKKKLNYIGPTKLKVSFVWLIGK